jgi:chromosome partitioning protein
MNTAGRMTVWAVANQKGGVGKTTTVVCCAGLLAEAGKRVLVVDLDPQGSLTAYFRLEPEMVRHGSYDLFVDAHLPEAPALRAMLRTTSVPGLSLLPASTALATVERRFRTEDGVGLRLARALESLRDDFDFVLIDTPPVLGVLMINALAAAEQLLLPVQTDFLAIKGLERMAHTLAMVVRARGRELRYCVVPTMFEAGNEGSVLGLRTLMQRFTDRVGATVVPHDESFRQASVRGLTPSQFAPFCRGVKAYRALLRGMGALDDEARIAL